MDKNQIEIWDALCNLDGETVAGLFTDYYGSHLLSNLDGETVARLFTDYYGNHLLTNDFREFMEEEGVI